MLSWDRSDVPQVFPLIRVPAALLHWLTCGAAPIAAQIGSLVYGLPTAQAVIVLILRFEIVGHMRTWHESADAATRRHHLASERDCDAQVVLPSALARASLAEQEPIAAHRYSSVGVASGIEVFRWPTDGGAGHIAHPNVRAIASWL